MKFDKIEQAVLKNLPIKQEQKQILQRRINKLKRDPKGFFEGSLAKRKDQARKYLPIKYDGKHNYTIVSAIYNVEKYLDQFFDSVVTQSLNFKNHIQIICVDDGSVDNSAQIIQKWQKKYPNNIHYYYKENGGQASARNLGLQYVQTEWVTFIDPDDFIDADYFKNTDDAICRNKNLKMVVANIKLYLEATQSIKDGHPLNYRFKQKEKVLPVLNLENYMNLSAAASFFCYEDIKNSGVLFNENIKPNFEDGKFIADYLLYVRSGNISFNKDIVYLYRKRSDLSSTIDTSWQKVEKYSNVLKYGFIPMLAEYQGRLGFVPKHIQRTVLYDMAWYVKYLLNQPEKTAFLSDAQKQDFQQYLEQIFSYIDAKEILDFNLAGVWFLHKVGMLETFKKDKVPSQIAYLENVDREKQQVLLSFFVTGQPSISIKLNGCDVTPVYAKNTIHSFNEKPFVIEKRLWVGFDSVLDVLSLQIDGVGSRISLKSKQHRHGLKIKDILKAFEYSKKYTPDGSWLLMDRDTQADDNAEHLYRYIRQHHPEQKCYFALNRESHDWDRLAADGFDLVEYGSYAFENRLSHASKIISSHLDRYINNYFGDEYEYSKKFVFLQHGITKDDLSSWFNMKKNLQCVITATVPEYHSLVDDNNGYRLTAKEVVLTGFPRHDNLVLHNNPDSKIIVIMPTWRRSILGDVVGDGNTRQLNQQFMQTAYAQHWYSLLHSQELKALTEQYGYQVIFAPHANIAPYLALFDVPEYINIWSSDTAGESMQCLFQKAKLMITDYSSVAFELAILGKMILYYQFDKETAFAGEHIYQKGYFDYDEHGFGPVVTEEQSLLQALQAVLQNGGEVLEPYATRIQETFPFRSGGCCQRVYEAIVALDEPEVLDDKQQTADLHTMFEAAYQNQAWDLVVERAEKLLEVDEQNDSYQRALVEGLVQTAQWSRLQAWHHAKQLQLSPEQQLKLSFGLRDWHGATDAFAQMKTADFESAYQVLQAWVHLGEVQQAVQMAQQILADEALEQSQRLAVQMWAWFAVGEYDEIVSVAEQLGAMTKDELSALKVELLLAKVYRLLGEYDLAHTQLVAFEKHTRDDVDCRIEIAELAFARQNYGKCIQQFDKLTACDYQLTEIQQVLYLQSIYETRQYDRYQQSFEQLPDVLLAYDELKTCYIKSLAKTQQWELLVQEVERLAMQRNEDISYEVVLAYYRLGLIEQAYQMHKKPTFKDCYEYWELLSEIALLMGDKTLEISCYRGMIAIYPNKNKRQNMDKLSALLTVCS